MTSDSVQCVAETRNTKTEVTSLALGGANAEELG